MRLSGKKILLGVTGSIAAYKSAELTRLLIKEGAEIQVVMTNAAHDFVTPLTLGTLSKKPVFTEFSSPSSGTWNNHVELGIWADAMLIAPASANTIAKIAAGYCDNLLLATYLSARCPVFIAPAMDLDMFAHPTTTQNISRILSFGNCILGPESGELASGLKGAGRMVEPENIVEYLIKALSPDKALQGKNVLISAGPTREAIDPVRFISNHSSGKMGVALAEEMQLRGAQVTLVMGPGVKKPSNGAIKLISVISAADMLEACIKLFPETDIAIMAAAVADFIFGNFVDSKMKKTGNTLQLDLIPTTDILATMGKAKKDSQFLVGFALETDNELQNAMSKLEKKNLNMIVLNSMKDSGAGFNSDTNKITIIEKNNKTTTPYDLKSKKEVATDIVDHLISCLSKS
ncbi:MAG: bifunctional phosphopantothenoylcysteine decarboxylase/phosphopantothenate--cysteine ligase CoaBC [Bacteroidetes bacterium]|nr:bifunctional phosphopantothenoylcysteine decarboxylase/phosphopantothenate--cysteine ligase CoaBC [Bacteroidota bacterium]